MKNTFRFLFVVFCLFTTQNPLLAQWVQTSGPNAGNVNSLVFTGTNLFAGAQGGVFLSSNNGTSWTALKTGPWVLSLAVSGTNLFAGTQGNGVLRSTDNGTNWTSISLMYPYVNALAVSGTNLFAGTGGYGVFLSTDNGTSWTAVNAGLTNPNVLSLTVSPASGGSGTNLFAGTQGSGVFLSTNNGTSWTAASTGLTYNNIYALAVSGTNLFAGTGGTGVFLSTNTGTSWTAVNAGLTNPNVLSLAVSPASGGSGTSLFAGTGGSGVFLSTNNGTSWTAASTGLTYNYVYALAVSGTNLFAGTGGGVSRRPLSEMITTSQPLIGIWNKASGPGDPITYNFLTNSIAVVVHNATWSDTVNYTTFAIPSSTLRGIDLGQNGVVGWRGVYQISSDSSTFQLEGYWYTGLPSASTPTSFTSPTTYARVANAQIPNGGFEDWTTQSGIEIPSAPWVTGNLLNKPAGVTYNPVTKSTDHYPVNVGSYSIRMENNISFVSDPGSATRYWPCSYGFSATAFYPGYTGPVFPTAGHPASLCGYYKFFPQNGDTMCISVGLYKNGTLVAGATFTNTKLVSEWTSFSIAISNYSSADSAQIGLAPFYAQLGKYPAGPYGNSILYVDNLSFNTSVPLTSVPTIVSFSPTSGPIGTRVTITGTNFSTTPANNIVYFGAVRGTVTSATSTSLTVTVPAGATYEPISVTVGGFTGYSSQPFIVTFPTVASITSGSLASKVDFATGTYPDRVAIGDIDGDGKPDLVVCNSGNTTVSVFRNTSTSGSITSGSFAANVDFTTGTGGNNVAIGDIDGDGKPDLVVTNAHSNTVSVFRNTSTSGSVAFAARLDLATGANPLDVAIGDIDGDGKPDMVVGNQMSNTVSVFWNMSSSSSIAFAAKVDFTTGTGPWGVAIGDIDSDGKPDLVVANISSNTVSVFRNTSSVGSITSGSLAAKVDFATGAGPYDVAVGDIDGDGKPDLVVGDYNGNTVSVFRNTSASGSITSGSFAAKVDFPAGVGPLGVAIGDIDGDARPDLAIVNVNSNTVSVFRNTSSPGSITSGSLAAKVDFTTGTYPTDVAIGDIDGDGKPDLVVGNNNSNTVSVLQNMTQSPHQQATLAAVCPLSASKGTDFSVEIRVGDSTRAANIFGLGFDLLYTNTSYIDFVSADTAGSFLGGNLLYIVTPDDANGKVSIGISRKAPLFGVSGGGTLIRLKFHAALTAPDSGTVTFSFSNVSANDQNGTSITLSPISGTTRIQGLSVWPGDADNSGVVNQSDILPLGLYWGSRGPARSNASLQWIAQSATAWAPQTATYADANGDGVVNQADVLPIGLNWGKIHSLGKAGSSIASGQMPTQASALGTPVLRATGPASVRGKTTFDVTVTLGDTVNPVSGLFGISFVLDFASSKSIIQVIEVTPGTFIGNDIIFFPQIDTTNGLVALGMTRKSGASNVAGFGQVAKIKFQVVNNTSTSSFLFTTRDISANDAGGNPVAVQPSSSSILVSVSDMNSVPVGFRLEQNYPNPFNPTTKIKYSITNAGMVALRVYDILGKEVATLVNEAQTPGLYEVGFNAHDLTSGVYYYRLQAGLSTETKALVLIR